jgi:hypothetical protein
MTKKGFIALADAIKAHNAVDTKTVGGHICRFTSEEINTLADFCKSQNPAFNRQRWLDYIAGKCGKNGGVK